VQEAGVHDGDSGCVLGYEFVVPEYEVGHRVRVPNELEQVQFFFIVSDSIFALESVNPNVTRGLKVLQGTVISAEADVNRSGDEAKLETAFTCRVAAWSFQ